MFNFHIDLTNVKAVCCASYSFIISDLFITLLQKTISIKGDYKRQTSSPGQIQQISCAVIKAYMS